MCVVVTCEHISLYKTYLRVWISIQSLVFGPVSYAASPRKVRLANKSGHTVISKALCVVHEKQNGRMWSVPSLGARQGLSGAECGRWPEVLGIVRECCAGV